MLKMEQAMRISSRCFILSMLFLLSISCSQKKDNIMTRDREIGLIFLNKDEYEINFKGLMRNLNKPSFDIAIEELMANVTNESSQNVDEDGREFNIEDLYSITNESRKANKKRLIEVLEKYKRSKTDEGFDDLGIDVLQPLLLNTAAAYFKNLSYCDLVYYPPRELSSVFNLLKQEINSSNSSKIEFENPYLPKCKNLEEIDQVYHAKLNLEVLRTIESEIKVLQKTMERNSKIENNINFIDHVIERAITGDVIVIVQILP